MSGIFGSLKDYCCQTRKWLSDHRLLVGCGTVAGTAALGYKAYKRYGGSLREMKNGIDELRKIESEQRELDEKSRTSRLDESFDEYTILCNSIVRTASVELRKLASERFDVDLIRRQIRESKSKEEQYALWKKLVVEGICRSLVWLYSTCFTYALARVQFSISGRYAHCGMDNNSPGWTDTFKATNSDYLGHLTYIQAAGFERVVELVEDVVNEYTNDWTLKSVLSPNDMIQVFRDLRLQIENKLHVKSGSSNELPLLEYLFNSNGITQSPRNELLAEMVSETRALARCTSFSNALNDCYAQAFSLFEHEFLRAAGASLQSSSGSELMPSHNAANYSNSNGTSTAKLQPGGIATLSERKIPLPKMTKPIFEAHGSVSTLGPSPDNQDIVDVLGNISSVNRFCHVVYYPLGVSTKSRTRRGLQAS
eukprot:62057_1